MRRKLEELERISRLLDPGQSVRKDLFRQAGDYAEAFLENLPQAKTYVPDEGRKGFKSFPVSEDPSDMADLLEFFRHEVDTTGILPASGGQMGYIPGGGLFPWRALSGTRCREPTSCSSLSRGPRQSSWRSGS